MSKNIQLLDAERGVYKIIGKRQGTVWQIGPNWRLNRILGSGTYGEVCAATDLRTNEQVALKRIENVLESPQLAKCVLREVCIVRRLRHKNIIGLHDVFLHVSSPDKWMEDGASSSKAGGKGGSGAQPGGGDRLDLYIAMELAEKGDIYSMRGAMAEPEVRGMMRQLLEACAYMHSCNVWHRDIKSANTLVNKQGVLKLCDFGLSRSGYTPQPTKSTGSQQHNNISPGTSSSSAPPPAPSQTPGAAGKQSASPLRRSSLMTAELTNGRNPAGLHRVYTKMVVTPTYRAPEVIMSHGQYSSAIDMWALGCIFGELLWQQLEGHEPRWKQLHFKPTLFAYCGEPETPSEGQAYMLDTKQSLLKSQLDIIFNRIGTPSWREIEGVPTEGWRKYLRGLQGRAGRLHRVLGRAGLEAVDLLRRLLEFDPERRCTAREALAHVYFSDGVSLPGAGEAPNSESPSSAGRWGLETVILQQQQERIDNAAWEVPAEASEGKVPFYAIQDPSGALAALEVELSQEVLEKDRIQWLLQREVEGEQRRWARRMQVLQQQQQQQQQQQVGPGTSPQAQVQTGGGWSGGGAGGGGGAEGAGAGGALQKVALANHAAAAAAKQYGGVGAPEDAGSLYSDSSALPWGGGGVGGGGGGAAGGGGPPAVAGSDLPAADPVPILRAPPGQMIDAGFGSGSLGSQGGGMLQQMGLHSGGSSAGKRSSSEAQAQDMEHAPPAVRRRSGNLH